MLLLETFEERVKNRLKIEEKKRRGQSDILWVMRRVSPVFVFRSNEFELEKHVVHSHCVSLAGEDCVEQEIL